MLHIATNNPLQSTNNKCKNNNNNNNNDNKLLLQITHYSSTI